MTNIKIYSILLIIFIFGCSLYAWAQTRSELPQPVINQALNGVAVAPADGTNLSLGATRALYNGNSTVCNIAVILTNDTVAVTFNNVQPGEFMAIRARTVQNTGTSCTNILALY